MKRVLLLILLFGAGGLLAGCNDNPLDRWLGIDRHHHSSAPEPAPAPAPAPTPAPAPAPTPGPSPTPTPTPARFETYRFQGTVQDGGTRYYGTVAPGDPVEGTFRIDFSQPVFFQNGPVSIYEAFVHVDGTVGGYAFSGENNLLYVQPNVSNPFMVDTGSLSLDGQRISFDFIFFVPGDYFPDGKLSNLRRLDQRTYSHIDLWFETFPGFGQGFSAAVTRVAFVAATN